MAKKILVIDDDRGVVELIENILADGGYEVSAAYDGKEGFESYQKNNPDLIILDINLPIMDGYEFLRAVRVESREQGNELIPVIMLTVKEEMEEIFKMEGAKGYLVKPVDPDSLVKKIEECL